MMDAWYPMRDANFTPCGRKCLQRLSIMGVDAATATTEQARLAFGDMYGRYYNEIVLTRAAFESALPFSIEAVFFVSGRPSASTGGVDETSREESFARAAFQSLSAAFGRSSPPLLRFDPTNRVAPFSHVEMIV